MKNPAKIALTKAGSFLRITPTEDSVQFSRTTSTQKPFTLEGVASMRSFSLSGVEMTKTPLVFIQTCWPRFGLPRG